MTEETQPGLSLPPPVAEAPPIDRLPDSRRQRVRRWLKWGLWIVLALIAWPVLLTLVYAFVNPPVSNVMIERSLMGSGTVKTWVSLDQMSPWLAKAVVTSEDARFCEHNGVDWIEFGGVVQDALDADEAPVRGASTIPMQTAKNLFLWDGRLFIRKGLEIPLALWMDLVWSKRRMLEIYLNIVEWAPGVYGAEAAAQHHFKKSATKLSRREAALLAAVLPNPIKRQAGKPSRGVSAIASRIMIRMAGMGPYLTCLGR
ncbi:monofunctional biosynthetic peptidoglycan transglycosylase [Aestuariivirga sp.]|uniref:monofunctional biosynthetic peptidoglycan transglycosylase n=1 Tax=Aestuariivirga sp. TaxID=2650926 RepID=UPI0039E6156F